MFSGKRILVIGGQGMMGQYFKAYFGEAAICPGRNELDLADVEKCREFVRCQGVGTIINCAGDAHGTMESIYNINGFYPGAIAKLCGELEVCFVFLSSSRLFDGSKQAPYTEIDPPNPIDDYGLSKFLGEKLVEKALYKKRYYVFRMAMVLGWRDRHPEGQLVTRLLRGYRPGCAFRVACDVKTSAVHAADVVAQVASVINAQSPPGIYNLCNNEAVSPFEIMRRIVKMLAVDASVEPADSDEFAGESRIPKYSALNSMKLPLLPGWEEVVGRFVVDHREQRVSVVSK